MKKPLLSEMTLREKIGQLLLAHQWDIHQDHEKNYEVDRTEEEKKALIGDFQFGAYWSDQIGSHNKMGAELSEIVNADNRVNSEKYRAFLHQQSQYGKIPALMGLDAEREGAGGLFKDLSTTCAPLAVGATDSEELVYELGVCLAKEIRCAGANWRWAPVVDVSHRFATGSVRTFAPDDPDRLIKLANAHIRGMQSEGVAATAKHFPGGDRYEYRDAHFSPAVLSSDMNEWWSEQGKIFKGVIDGGVYSIMTGHQAFPACDDSKLHGKFRPAVVSKRVITDLLKGELGFKGVVITDAINMAGLTGCYDSYEDMIIDLVNAGNDVLLGVKLPARDIIEKAVQDGRIPESRIDDACQRVLDMKEKMGMFEEGYWTPPYKAEDVVPQTQKLNREIAKRAITLVRDTQNLLPMDASKIKNVTIVCSAHIDEFFKKLQYMKKAFEDRGIQVNLQRRISSAAEMDKIVETSDLIIYAAYVMPHKPKGHMGLYGDECATYLHAFSKGQTKSIGLSMGYPYMHYDLMGNAETFINAYGWAPELMDAFVEAIFGEIPIVGKSPVKIIPDPLWV